MQASQFHAYLNITLLLAANRLEKNMIHKIIVGKVTSLGGLTSRTILHY